jgi:hypothetical protein
MAARDILKREFDAKDGSFLMLLRAELRWDWIAFRRLTGVMYDVADEVRGKPAIESWIAEGFWYCDTWIKEWTHHPDFPRPSQPEHLAALALIHDLSYFLFIGESPYSDATLQTKAKG